MGQSLSSPVDSVYVEKRHFDPTLLATVGTAQGMRISHEDGHIMKAKGNWLCCAVLDGHGGSDAAIHFSSVLGDAVLEALNNPQQSNMGQYDEPRKTNPDINDGTKPEIDATDQDGKARELSLMERKVLAAQRGVKYAAVESDMIDSSVKAAFAKCDAEWRQRCSAQMQSVGTTVTMACVKLEAEASGANKGKHEVRLYNCGDSRGCVFSKDGQVLIETRDHKPDDEREKRRIEAAEGYVTESSLLGPARVDGLLAVSRALGDYQQKDEKARAIEQKVCPVPDSYTHYANPTDLVVLCCDGVFDVISSEEVGTMVGDSLKGGMPSPQLCEKLLRESFTRKSQDNCTCCVVQLNKAKESSRDYMLLGDAAKTKDESVHNHVKEFHRTYKFGAELSQNAEKGPGETHQ